MRIIFFFLKNAFTGQTITQRTTQYRLIRNWPLKRTDFLNTRCLQTTVEKKLPAAADVNMLCPVLPSGPVRAEPLGLCVCILSGVEPGQLVEGPGASLSSEVEA